MKTETIEWFTPEEKLPKDPSYNIMVKTGSNVTIDWTFFAGLWCSDYGTETNPDFWAYQPKGPQ